MAWLAITALGVAAVASDASAAPKTGELFPSFIALDVTGQKQSTARFRGTTTLIVAITERGAGDAMRAWFLGARERNPKAHQVGIISISVPFFVSDSYARSKAREKIPQQYWHDNLFDSNQQMARFLGLPESGIPWVFVLDAQGRIVAQTHALAETNGATPVWKALASEP